MKRHCTLYVVKTKALISCALVAQLICVFVFTYAKSRFSHEVAHITLGSPCCILEQDTFTSQKVLEIPRKLWLLPDMTEKLLTGT